MLGGLTKRLFGRRAGTIPIVAAASPDSIAEIDRLIARGNSLEDEGKFEVALSCYREGLATAADYARLHMNIGNALRGLRRPEEAIVSYRDAVRCAPGFAPARFNLGAALAMQGDIEAAEHELRAAMQLQPTMVEAAITLADILESDGRLADAESMLQHALRIRPDFAGAALNLGQLLLRQRRFDEAEPWLLRAKTLDPGLAPDALSNFLFRLNYRSDLDASDIFSAHVQCGSIISRWAGLPFLHWSNVRDPERPLKVGYVSGDFGEHPIGLFMRPLFEQHDRARVEVYGYSNLAGTNQVQRKLIELVDHWREIAHLSNFEVARQVRADEIDILVDLSGHASGSRLAVFALRPAPVQVTWLGYLNTTGLRSVDYRICDWYTDPHGATEHLHTERLFRMPHSQWCYAPWYDVPPVPEPHVERPGAIVFGSFNHFEKISDACLDLWCRILERVPEAELVVLGIPEGRARTIMLERLTVRGIEPARVSIRGRTEILAYFAAVGNVDVALDSFPYNGGTTTFDTLWMGIPLVALRGERGIARGGYSILKSLQMPELVTCSPDEYVEANVRLARDDSLRRRLRASLRSRLAASPLMDASTFVADLEAGYREMWRTWCDAQMPARL